MFTGYSYFKRAVLAYFIISILCSCSTKKYRYSEGVAWNTLYRIKYESSQDLQDSIFLILNEIDFSLSPFNENSTVSKINSNVDYHLDTHFKTVYQESKRINRESGGAFDPTLAPLIRAWGFGQGHEISADTLRLDSLLNLIGIQKTTIDGMNVVKDNPAIEFNFSAIAKGYGVDCVAGMLQRNGVFNYLVEIGGEIRASGINEHGKPWTIGIDRPEVGSEYGNSVEIIEVNKVGLATSGNYRNYHEEGGKRFGHTISPFTGRPVQTEVISATVIAPTCMEADALATTCMILGKSEAIALCNRLNTGVMLILSDMTIVRNKLFPKQLSCYTWGLEEQP